MTPPPADPLRIAVVEDDARYRASLEELFAHAEGFQLAGSYSSPPPAIAVAERAARDQSVPWDIVVMDLDLPAMNGIEATRRVKALIPAVKVVVLTVFEEPASILQAVCAGADGYLLKRSRVRELVEGLRAVADGGSPLTSNIARTVLDLMRTLGPASLSAPATPTRLDLTEREQEVLRALVDGLSYKQAADRLGISLGTLRSHVTAVYRKLQVHNVAEAVSRAVRQRLV